MIFRVFFWQQEKPFPERQESDRSLNTEPFCGIFLLLVFCKYNEIFAVQFIPGLDEGPYFSLSCSGTCCVRIDLDEFIDPVSLFNNKINLFLLYIFPEK
jgi:hypothetical protein